MGLSLHPEHLKRYRDVARRLAMLFFLAAAGGGLWLVFDILRSDRPPRSERIAS